jgi:hypothetical protein
MADVPRHIHFARAQTIALKFVDKVARPIIEEWNGRNGVSERDGNSRALSDLVGILEESWNLITGFKLVPTRLRNALPRSLEGVNIVRNDGIRGYFQNLTSKPISELVRTGRCITNIRGTSHSVISQAGRGAVATTAIKKGQTITGTPFLYVPNHLAFELYEGDWNDKDTPPRYEELVGYQIMYNYCWDHPNSTMLLCPYGSIVNYINHGRNSTRRQYNDSSIDAFIAEHEVNVEWKWPKHGDMFHNATWFNRSVADFGRYNPSPGLFIDLVAARDIAAGEEVFMDYGERWEAAWLAHTKRFFSRNRTSSFHYRSAWDLNRMDPHMPLYTPAELRENPYPPNIVLRCHPYVADKSRRLFAISPEVLWQPDVRGFRCHVLARESTDDNRTTYTVDFYQFGEKRQRNRVDRAYLAFFDRPYTTNVHVEASFRHPIGFPDHLFPVSWRNKLR